MPHVTRKEAIWLSCKEKSCCYASFVVMTGRDVWRISRALDAPPWSFLVYFRANEPRPDAFALDKSGEMFRLALTKQPSRRKKTPAPCIFLMKTRDGYHRCGLGDLRPRVCKTFPADMLGNVVGVPGKTGCSCRAWSLADMDAEVERQGLLERLDEFYEYCSLVEEWNSFVASQPDTSAFDFYTFCNFVLQAYDGLEAQQTSGQEASGQP